MQTVKEERLPTLHRTIKFPPDLWARIKNYNKQDKKSVRRLVDEALDSELPPLVKSLQQLGLRGEIKHDKLVRLPLDDNIIARLNHARRQTGLSAILLLKLCLEKFID
jgi:hypothetical protein